MVFKKEKMKNLNILETFRTKKELVNYFKKIGQDITEEEIEALKQSYAKAEANGNTLTLQQLNDVAGGLYLEFRKFIDAKANAAYKRIFRGKYIQTIDVQDCRTDKLITVFVHFDHKDSITVHDFTTGTEISAEGLTVDDFCRKFPDLAPLAARGANHSIYKIKYYKTDPKHANCGTDVKVLEGILKFVKGQPHLKQQWWEIEQKSYEIRSAHKSGAHKRSREERDTAAHYFQSTRGGTPIHVDATKGRTEPADQPSSPLAVRTASVAGHYNPPIAMQPKPEAPKDPAPYRPPMTAQPKTLDAVFDLPNSAAVSTGVELLTKPEVPASQNIQPEVTLSWRVPVADLTKLYELAAKLERDYPGSTSISSSSEPPANKRLHTDSSPGKPDPRETHSGNGLPLDVPSRGLDSIVFNSPPSRPNTGESYFSSSRHPEGRRLHRSRYHRYSYSKK